MAYDYEGLSVDELLTIATTDADEFRRAAIDELTRRSELAAKYERLTRALAGLKRDLLVKPVCVSIGYLDEGEWDESSSHPHDGTPDGIAAAIIAAAEGAK